MEPRHPYLFVYGTLQSAFHRNRFARYLAREAVLLGRATVPGRLYALRRYPALRPARAADQQVSGELHRLFRPAPTLRVLDGYEDRQYRRILTTATLPNGCPIRCWTYEWKTPLPRHRQVAPAVWTVSR